MANPRIYELSKKLGIPNKTIIAALSKLGIKAKTHSSSVEPEIAKKIKDLFQKKDKEPTKAVKPTKPKKPSKVSKPTKVETPVKAKKPTADIISEKPLKPVVEKKPKKKKVEEELPPEIDTDLVVEPEKPDVPLPSEEIELKIPERFKKDIETEKIEKFKAKPGMQRAFQAIRKIEPKRWQQHRPFKRGGRARHLHKEEHKQEIHPVVLRKKTLKLSEGTTVKEFSELIGVKLSDVIKKFMELGYMPTINQPVDTDAGLLVADNFGIKLEPHRIEEDTVDLEMPEDAETLLPRPPVITIMGHVDHGKTSLLDAIRETRVTETEAGGITQHIGAYKINVNDKDIVFLDTPGHEAFTAMRARGAKVTDIVVLVVAADDGVMPQTIEAINHANAANVPIVIAINKIDKPEANFSKVKNELSDHHIISEEWGGKNIFVEVSAKQRIGLEHLLEMILLQAEIMELKAHPDKMARGTIIEAKLDKGRGPVATVLVQAGKLNIGDAFVSGTNTGKVRALNDDTGKKIAHAGPSTPVEVIGFQDVPSAGDVFVVVEDEKRARQIALSRQQKQKTIAIARKGKLTLDELYAKIKEGEIKELSIIIKGDVQGSVEAIRDSLETITHPEVKVRVIHSSAGGINVSDVMLATASSAIILGFNVRPEIIASQLAEKEGVDIRLYTVIYDAIDDIKKALEGLLEPTLKEKILGRAEVRQVFPISRIGTVAGCYVIDGFMSRSCDGVRIIRDNIVVYDGQMASLKRFKEDTKEVQTGYECGILIESFNDIKVGDIFENYIVEKIATKLQ